MATYDSMLEEFRSLIYKDGWGLSGVNSLRLRMLNTFATWQGLELS